ncbi:hypothetical protein GGR56DRAFT_624529 [Xylariaceae sp. FL0804]|nr:hypothetical protein GGR56DRAFT_624529 [Xylariaceae sp. FL0804]
MRERLGACKAHYCLTASLTAGYDCTMSAISPSSPTNDQGRKREKKRCGLLGVLLSIWCLVVCRDMETVVKDALQGAPYLVLQTRLRILGIVHRGSCFPPSHMNAPAESNYQLAHVDYSFSCRPHQGCHLTTLLEHAFFTNALSASCSLGYQLVSLAAAARRR